MFLWYQHIIDRPTTKKMKNVDKCKIIFLFLYTGLFLTNGCDEIQNEEQNEELAKSVNVEVEEITPSDFSSFLRLVGTVETSDDIQVSSEISGRIEMFYLNEGDQIQKGEVIAKIDDRKLQQEARRLQALTTQSEENYLRLKRLYEEENIGSEIDFINAKYTFQQNEAALESIKVDIENTEIKSPVQGIVEEMTLEEGEMISAGTPVARIIGRERIKISFGVPARYAGDVDINDEAEVWFDHNPEQSYLLPITFVGQSISPQNRTFKTEALFQNAGNEIKIDMLANVKLRTEYLRNKIVVNEEFIHQNNGKTIAFVVGTDNDMNGNRIAVERELELGPSFGNRIVVKRGLEVGEKLITAGSSYLLDQTRIEIVDNATEFADSNN